MGPKNELSVWDPNAPEQGPLARLHSLPVASLEVSGDGTLLLSGHSDGEIAVWPVPRFASTEPR